HHESRHAEIFEALHAVRVWHGTPRGDLDRPRVAADLLALLTHDAEEPYELFFLGHPGEEPITVAGRAARGELRVTADDDRDSRLLHRLRVRLELLPAVELAMERRRLVLPERADRAHRLSGAGAPLRERDAEGLELLFEPADADAEDHPPVREHVQRRHLLGDVQRVALRQDQN